MTIIEALDFAESGSLPNFGPPFMAHAPASAAEALSHVTRTNGVGAAITTRDRNAARRAAHTIYRNNSQAAVLVDADQYSGGSRRLGSAPMTASWVNWQLKIGLRWALTDSGYIAQSDRTGLRDVLTWRGDAAQVITALPLAKTWLTHDSDILIDEIISAGGPVALMLEDASDPLASVAAVSGLIASLRAADVAVLVMRSDSSALGALAHGAAAVSVGVKSSLRHIFPIVDGGGGWAPPTSAFVPGLLTYKYLTAIDDAITRNPDLPVWVCTCTVCCGRRLDWIIDSVDPHTAAFEHSLAAQAELAQSILATDVHRRPSTWRDMCARAQLRFDDITTKSNKSWRPPKALKAWVSSTPVPHSSIR